MNVELVSWFVDGLAGPSEHGGSMKPKTTNSAVKNNDH